MDNSIASLWGHGADQAAPTSQKSPTNNSMTSLWGNGADQANSGDSKSGKQVDAKSVQAIQGGADPDDLVWARKHMDDASYIGYCEQFVGDANNEAYPRTGHESAISTWRNAKNRVEGFQGIKKGDAVYFDTMNTPGNAGHTAIYSGDNNMISGGWKERNINEWATQMGQTPLGYVPYAPSVPAPTGGVLPGIQ